MKGGTAQHLEEDKYISERAEVVLTKATVKIGVISAQHPTWVWHLGTIGKVQWMRSPTHLMGRMDHDPAWINGASREQDMTEVEAIVIHGEWPSPEDPVWDLDTLTVAVRIQMKQRRRTKKLKVTLAEGWRHEHTYVIQHDEVGGVTNGEFQVDIRSKNCAQPIVPINPPGVSAKLGSALGGLENGREVDKPPEEGKLNSAAGILDWKSRSGNIHTTTVFRPGKGVIRKMTVREKGRVLDFPDTRTMRMTDDEINILIESEIPGKVVTASLYFLTTRRASLLRCCNFVHL